MATKSWRKRNPERAAASDRRRRYRWVYGLEVEEYEEMLARQDGKCAICGGVNADGRRLLVDHDHETGTVRGLLCHKCNAALGLAGEDEFRLIAMADYLLHARVEEEFALAY